MTLRKIGLILGLSLMFWGCTEKSYDKQESILLVFKTAIFKHNDLAFLYQNPESMKIEIYSNGQVVSSLKLDNKNICLSFLECMSNKAFNAEVLSSAYPEHLLMNVLRGRTIFAAKNLQNIRNGFTQKIVKEGKYAIDYRVFNNDITFSDKINNILIKVKRLE
ncbi:MAG: hypothetical protein GQ531_03465 [Sulfurovum sp.]|nr:hypothetical protein [Sulfurovum sp.]